MYIFSIILVALSVFLLAVSGEAGILGLFHFFDIVSMLAIIIIFISMMAASGLFKDFNNAFKLAMGKKNAESILELKKAKEAIRFAQKLFIVSGLLGTLMGIIMVGYGCSTIESITINMSVALLTMFYGLVLYIFLLPIQLRIEIKISEFMQI